MDSDRKVEPYMSEGVGPNESLCPTLFNNAHSAPVLAVILRRIIVSEGSCADDDDAGVGADGPTAAAAQTRAKFNKVALVSAPPAMDIHSSTRP